MNDSALALSPPADLLAHSLATLSAREPGRRYRIAIIGAGRNARFHAAALRLLDAVCVTDSVIDPDPAQRTAFGEDTGTPHRFASVEEMLEKRPCDAAIVSTPTSVRREVCFPLFAARVPLLLEKPMADNLADATAIVAEARRCRAVFSVNQNFRYLFPFFAARALLQTGVIGSPRHLVQQAMYLRRDQGWRTQQARNVMSVMSIHWLDGYRWLFPASPVEIYCRTLRLPVLETEGEAATSLILSFGDGAVAALSESFGSFHPAGRDNHYCHIDGTAGGLTLQLDGTIQVSPRDGTRHTLAGQILSKQEANAYLLCDVMNAAFTSTEPAVSGADNLQTIALLEAAYRSAAEGAPQRLPTP